MIRKGGLLAAAIALTVLAYAPTASASWHGNGAGSGYSKANALSGGNTPGVAVSGRNVTVSWSASGGTVPVGGYLVKRYNTANQQQTIGAGCTGTIVVLTCTENVVPAGDWKYTVTPVQGNWHGTGSATSATATVAAPTLTLDPPSTVTSLPATASGQINSSSLARR